MKWIPVSERLPDANELVLAVNKTGDYDLGWFGYNGAFVGECFSQHGEATHWMQLPQPPEEK